ncbi:beta-ketoacyl-ACP synthase III [Jeongeupia chitinilytica]|uniref:Beta-ketoacyl-[acyl-carrier-protein] synthase III n=1 Tax=Jeongeupia chitinilytica TaxID=1041641 RepID=A0ABQ3H201_9NEIS|nr:beta-ketoacyl-ACP synthase III [Jeongeupia chitinilytica]GHD66276.1 3-oxoacyl-[acyl-carrier-protein] synthase 3 [Jeongeupia chitinilytica]
MYARIAGTGSYLPEHILTNAALAQRVDTSDEWIASRTGIRQRHIAADTESTSDLALKAAERALLAASTAPEEVDLIIVATTTPDHVFPSTACTVQDKLGLHGFPAFDVQAVCAGFVYALTVADAMIKSGAARCAVVIGAEKLSNIIDWNDRTTCVLFGDGAGAVVLKASDEPGILASKLHADGRYRGILNAPGHLKQGQVEGSPWIYMDGGAVFKFAVRALADVANETLAAAGVDQADVDWLVPHQANLRIIESTAKHLHLSMDKVIVTVDKHGNTSAASIPLALDEGVRTGKIQRGQTVLLEGIGGGFAWGSVLFEF